MKATIVRLLLVAAMFLGFAGMANAHLSFSDDVHEVSHAGSSAITEIECCHSGEGAHGACPVAIKTSNAIFASEHSQYPQFSKLFWGSQTLGTQSEVLPDLRPPIQ